MKKETWIDARIESPIKNDEYVVIGESMTGKVLKEIVQFSTDDGWQSGNNWNILLWKQLRK